MIKLKMKRKNEKIITSIIVTLLCIAPILSPLSLGATSYNEASSDASTIDLYTSNGYSIEYAENMIEKVDNGYEPYSDLGYEPVEIIEKITALSTLR